MERLLHIGRTFDIKGMDVTTVSWERFETEDFSTYDAVIISGGDGSIRRCVELMHRKQRFLPVVPHPTGSFNVIAKQHRIRHGETLLEELRNGTFAIVERPYYTLNDRHVFLFSAGNMGDLHHIFVAETLRFGLLKHGMAKYLLTFLLLLPMHLLLTPFMLASKHRFFIFTPIPYPKKLGSFRNDVDGTLHLNLDNDYNFLELDGDIVPISSRTLSIEKKGIFQLIVPSKR